MVIRRPGNRLLIRRTPYTEAGIRRKKCIRCRLRRARFQWHSSICANANRGGWMPLCAVCDVALNRYMLKFFRDPQWKTKATAYARHVAAG